MAWLMVAITPIFISDLDDFVGLDGHALRQLADRDGLGDLHVALDRRRRPLEAVPPRASKLHRHVAARPARASSSSCSGR